ncbi:methyl-accepting chemotaxis protein [Caulobacter ginsengisoli]|uniref:Methyl-accepting chemotaxis protein n=1 Tax=Caulobacter ginsengisoli TaxID=400775 RepID=A0ABU0IX61_9CAUL|nr:methyl-accepting chemotaxis protein [Caulobacter ginsengisoli]MDQ0465542.1 methyl-accepting chemotaxis protein [Caulobacter ginsengisoli]
MLRWYFQDTPIKGKLSLITLVMIGLGATTAALSGLLMIGLDKAAKVAGSADLAALQSSAHTLFYFASGAVVLSVVFGFGLAGAIAGPLHAVASRLERMAAGDLDGPISHTEQKDDAGRLARATLALQASLAKRQEVEAALADSRARDEAGRAQNDQDRQRLQDEQRRVVDGLAQGLDRLSAGDLTYRISTAFPPAHEKLREDFNAAMGELQSLLGQVAAATGGLRAGSADINAAADDLSRRTEQQAASLEETAAALDQITATVRRTAEGAEQARAVVGSAKTAAEHSGEVVRKAIDAMSEIEGSSNQISRIIGVIDEIAFQTNLLALNAGVEAARAGDAGRGFAVVASEVRALAQRSADAAKEIKALISASTRQVGAGVSLVGETGAALGKIVTQVAEINAVVSEIAASAQEQATGLGQVNSAVNQMDQVVQQNAAMVEQSTAAAHALQEEAGDLAQLLQRFNTGVAVGTQRAPRQQPTFSHSNTDRANTGRANPPAAPRPAPRAAIPAPRTPAITQVNPDQPRGPVAPPPVLTARERLNAFVNPPGRKAIGGSAQGLADEWEEF